MASKTPSAKMNTPAPVPATPLLERVRQSGRVEELIQAATERARVRGRRRRRIRTAALGVLAISGLLGWSIPYVRSTDTLATAAARRTAVVLADGSQAELNANTELFADFRYGRRTVTLRQGEAFFSVATDAAHPFLVKTHAGTVRVTGTKFNVRLADRGAEVTLLEGSVSVEEAGRRKREEGGSNPETNSERRTSNSELRTPISEARSIALSPGQQLTIADGHFDLRTLSPADLSDLTAWRQGRLALRGLTLDEVVQRLAAYHGCEIDCAPEVAGLRPGGNFALDDFTGFIEAMEATLPVRVLHRGDRRYTVVLR